MSSGQPDLSSQTVTATTATAANTYPHLLGDVGGTNARFALVRQAGQDISDSITLSCADHASLQDAIEHYFTLVDVPRPRWGAIGIANPVIGDEVRMTNHHWTFSIDGLRRNLGFERFEVVNDFTALALAIPLLCHSQLLTVGNGTAVPHAALGLIGAGTGLGVSGLIPLGDKLVPLSGEGGHVTMAAADEFEDEVINRLRRRFQHVSAERILSGPGLRALHSVLADMQGVPASTLTSAEITAYGLSNHDPLCRLTLDTFCAMLGTVSANLALMLGARGGIYIGGGIVPKFGDYFRQSPFRSRFEQKGRFSNYLAEIPTYVILAEHPAFLGVESLLKQEVP